MLIIHHRINSLRALSNISNTHGVEIDVRHSGCDLIVEHDPFKKGVLLDTYLRNLNGRFLVINTKEDGLETQILKLLKRHRVQKYFFLDLSNPTLIRLARQGVKKLAVRFSDFESLESCLQLKGKVNWVWVDCFTKFPMHAKNYFILKRYFNICLVCPMLQKHSIDQARQVRRFIHSHPVEAVCTDVPSFWQPS